MGLEHLEVSNHSDSKARLRFATLDALRGMGALTVMAGHAGVMLNGYSPHFMYLSVDMFFVLSGFVLAHAYDNEFHRGLTAYSFLRSRVKRLYPIYLVGLSLGLAILYVNIRGLPVSFVVLSLVCNLFALPSPPAGEIQPLFPLNESFWSLFFEFWIANLMFGLIWRHLHGRRLFALISLSAALLIFLGLRAGTLQFGWTWNEFIGGLARVCFSFFSGVALSRLHSTKPPKTKIPSSLCLGIFAAIVTSSISTTWSVCYELAVVLLVFPALIFFGAEATEHRPRLGRALGDASYATYVIHRPMVYLLVGMLPLHLAALSFGMTIGIEIAIMILVVGLAMIVNAIVMPDRMSAVK
jgi:peptidoglycan/LPS O-acetylase OafA/YrhL